MKALSKEEEECSPSELPQPQHPMKILSSGDKSEFDEALESFGDITIDLWSGDRAHASPFTVLIPEEMVINCQWKLAAATAFFLSIALPLFERARLLSRLPKYVRKRKGTLGFSPGHSLDCWQVP